MNIRTRGFKERREMNNVFAVEVTKTVPFILGYGIC